MELERRPFQLLVVFHKFLVAECYETLSLTDISGHLRFIAVNAKIPKTVPKVLLPYIIYERSMQWYNPFLQHNRFCESSVFFHAWKNPQTFLAQNEYIGFVHYDMLVKKECLEFLTTEIAAARSRGEQVLFVHKAMEARQHLQQVIGYQGWDRIVGIYNAMFGTRHDIYKVLDRDIPLYHTYVLHRDTFHRMMCFAEEATAPLFEMIGFDTKHLPFMLERMHGVFLALQQLDGALLTWLPMPGVVHEDRLKDDWKPIVAADAAAPGAV